MSLMPEAHGSPDLLRKHLKLFGVFALAVTMVFAAPMLELARFAWHSDLHSYALLIPFVSAYLIWLRQDEARPAVLRSVPWACGALVVGLGAIGSLWLLGRGEAPLNPSDRLALSTFSYLCFLGAGAFLLLGAPLLRHFAFPTALLFFLIPMPVAVENAVEVFFQHASAEAAALLFAVTGTTVFREDLLFRLPGITLEVAQECSGIRSTVVLFITSLIAGNMFLRSPWRRASLTMFVIPLAILRNGFRVFTIGMLCVHVDPSMVESPIHHKGGPIFFVLSLIPFSLLLFWLRRNDLRGSR